MIISDLPKKIQKEIDKLTQDEQFQKILDEDEVLDKLFEFSGSSVILDTLTYQQDYRLCQLVANYLVDNEKIKTPKVKWFRKLYKFILIKALLHK